MCLKNGFLMGMHDSCLINCLSGTLTTQFFARLKPLSDTKFMLLYPTVLPSQMSRFMLQGRMYTSSPML